MKITIELVAMLQNKNKHTFCWEGCFIEKRLYNQGADGWWLKKTLAEFGDIFEIFRVCKNEGNTKLTTIYEIDLVQWDLWNFGKDYYIRQDYVFLDKFMKMK